MNILNSISNFINKDVASDNESKRMTVLIRKLLVLIIGFSIVSTAYIFFNGYWKAGALSLCGVVLVAFVMKMSFSSKRMTTVWAFIISIIVMSWINLSIFGWFCGAQTFLIILVMIYYFSSYSGKINKIAFSTFIFVIYMIYYFKFRGRTPNIQLNGFNMSIVRLVFMLCLVICCSMVAYIFSLDSQSMEVKLVEYNKRLEEKASTDPLTGLYNRGKIMDVLDGLSSKGEVFSLCICDIDFFKNVNDNYGHNAGDLVLKNVANIFAKNIKNLGYVARWGGEEFIMIFPGKNGDEACASVYNLQDQVRKSTVKYEDFEIKVTLTYGLTEYDFNSPLDRNIKDADDKLYIGKDKGRNVVIY